MKKRITFKHELIYLLIVFIMVCISGCGKKTENYIDTDMVQSKETETQSQQALEEKDKTEVQQTECVCVYICGSVREPGVYFLEAGSRVCDVLKIAGGFTEEAATDYWNQARVLVDGEMLYVPTKEEAAEQAVPDMSKNSGISKETEEKININTASKEELMKIPTVGETRAENIIAYRKKHGAFSEISDIKQVSGIKDGVFDKIKDYIVVN